MTTVNTTTTPTLGNTSRIDRQQAIENALTTALYFIRLPATDDEDNPVCLPIGPPGLIALGELLTAIGKNREFHGC